MSTRFLAFAVSLALALAVHRDAAADERQTETPPPDSTAQGGTTVVAPPGSGGVTVVVPTAGGGTVMASGCSSVVVNGAPTMVTSTGAPCPLAAYQPYTPPPPMPYYDIRPKYASDPDRKAAVIGSSIGFGVGGGIAGIMYLVQWSDERSRCQYDRTWVPNADGSGGGTYVSDSTACSGGGARASLITYGAIMTFLPSLPRFVVGDTTKGLVYTALRGVSFATAALAPWGDKPDTKWQGPFLLGFVVPVTLGIIDLATTPHREDLEPKVAKPGIGSVSPVAVADPSGKTHGAMISVGGLF